MYSSSASALGSELEHEVLPLVAKPHRYVGQELGGVRKDWDAARVRMLFCYPDLYEVGMSHTGTQILYHVVNRRAEWLMERAYAPWPDMELRMRERGIPLFSLESRRPAGAFDVVGFTLQSELTYTNVLTMLDLAGIPLRRAGRGDGTPLVLGGGPGAANPEPLAAFFDAFLIGDAEDALPEILGVVERWKGDGADRQLLLRELAASVPGVYVPHLYAVPAGGSVARPRETGVSWPVMARTVPVLRPDDHPRQMLIPLAEVTHERLPIEVQRGCVRGCRFCQAGYLYRPVREREVEDCVAIADEGLRHGGQEEVSLLSLSTADHSQVAELAQRVGRLAAERGAALALPSLRADAFSPALAEAASRVRRTGFTFAPEAGSERLRRVINKGLDEADILAAIEGAFAAGWSSVKLYLMIGHPTEGPTDLEELARLVHKIRVLMRRHGARSVVLSVAPFVPKPHTPFQYERQDPLEVTREKLRQIRRECAGRGVEVKHHDLGGTVVEGLLARGGRETADLIEGAWRRGARFDGWTEQLRLDAWLGALEEIGSSVDARFAERREDEALPWEVVSYGIERGWFARERHKAYAGETTEDCKLRRCSACGVCDFEVLQNRLAERPLAVGHGRLAEQAPADGQPPSPSSRQAVVRLRYSKVQPLRFLSHLELLRELSRICRRAEVPVALSAGLAPRPRLSAGPALATGSTSASEWVDAVVAGAAEWGEPRLAAALAALNRCAPAGLAFHAAGVLDGKCPSLATSLAAATYRATFPRPPFTWSREELDAACRAFLARDVVAFERVRGENTRTIDVRPFVHDLSALDERTVALELRTLDGWSARPTEVLAAACGVPRHLLPLLIIHKTDTRLAGGGSPLAGCAVAVGDDTVETGNSDQWHDAGDPRGDSRGRHPC
jgi:radical SAM family uncharacterized protein/radical SAM-linked protein